MCCRGFDHNLLGAEAAACYARATVMFIGFEFIRLGSIDWFYALFFLILSLDEL
jgi:hypothetical protein